MEITRKSFIRSTLFSLFSLNPFYHVVSKNKSKNDNDFKSIGMSKNNDWLRVITYNIFNGGIGYKGINGFELPEGENSWLVKKARDKGQITKRIMLELSLYEPDVINFTESAKEFIVANMARSINYNYVHFPGGKDGMGNYPGSILTSYEIVHSENRPFVNKDSNNPEELFTRHWGKAIIRLPNGRLLSIHSAHLWPFKREQKDTDIRLSEIGELLKSIEYDLKHVTDSVLLQGDLNQVPNTPEYKKYMDAGLFDTYEISSDEINSNTINSINPQRRIDYILAKGEIENKVKSHRVLFEGNFRTNNDDPSTYALSDHLPVMVDFEI